MSETNETIETVAESPKCSMCLNPIWEDDVLKKCLLHRKCISRSTLAWNPVGCRECKKMGAASISVENAFALAVTKDVCQWIDNSIRLILIRGIETDGDHVDNILLDLSFASIVMLIGLNNITSQVNVERLKREIRPCFPALDEILARTLGIQDSAVFSHLCNCAEYILPPDQLNIQHELEKYTDCIETSFGCLLLTTGQILFATKSFWALSNTELVLLPLLLSCKPSNYSAGRDLPIYLPDRSPNVPFRMLVFRLLGPLLLITLCGPNPSLYDAIKTTTSYWGSHFLTLDAIVMASACSIPPSVHANLDKAVLGILLINYDSKRCISCVHFRDKADSRTIPCSPKNPKSGSYKANVLSSVYRSIVGSLFQPPASPPDDLPILKVPFNHTPTLAYITTEEFKVFVVQKSPYHLLVLYPPLLPLHIAREISMKTLDSLTKGKGVKV